MGADGGSQAFLSGKNSSPMSAHTERITKMPAKLTPLTKRPAWEALAAHYKQPRAWRLRELFAEDPKRGERLRQLKAA